MNRRVQVRFSGATDAEVEGKSVFLGGRRSVMFRLGGDLFTADTDGSDLRLCRRGKNSYTLRLDPRGNSDVIFDTEYGKTDPMSVKLYRLFVCSDETALVFDAEYAVENETIAFRIECVFV